MTIAITIVLPHVVWTHRRVCLIISLASFATATMLMWTAVSV